MFPYHVTLFDSGGEGGGRGRAGQGPKRVPKGPKYAVK